MPTVSSIGTGKDYTTIQSWHDAFAAGGWIGELYNQGSAYANANLTGKATSATDYITLRCATGQSFKDDANKLTNPLRYDVSKGAAVSGVIYTPALTVAEPYTTISGIQFFSGGGSASGDCLYITASSNVVIENCILDIATVSGNNKPFYIIASANAILIRNCAMIVSGATIAVDCSQGQKIYNCTIVRVGSSGVSGTGVSFGYSSGTMKNCAVFGFSTVVGSGGSTNTTCATDSASPPSGFTGSLTYSSQFENTGGTTANRDFRTKAGAGLIDAGTTDTTNVPASDDIVGTSRSGTWDIGAWEVAGSPPAEDFTPRVIFM